MSHEQNESQTKSKHVTLGLVCAWFFGVLFAISVVTFFVEGDFIASIISLLMAAMLLPPVWKKIQDKMNLSLSSGVKIVLVIVGVVLVGFVSTSPTPSSTTSTTTETTTQKATEPLLELVSETGSFTAGGNYFKVQGQVKNLTDENLESIQAVVSVFDSEGNFIASDEALIDYNPVLPGQTSPFSVMIDGNPEIAKYRVEFKEFWGGTIETRDSTK